MSTKTYKGTLLMDEQPLSVQPTLAQMYGTDEAIFLQQVYWWRTNPYAFPVKEGQEPEVMQVARYQDRLYVRLDLKQALDKRRGRLRFMSESTLRRCVTRLRSAGVLLVERFAEHQGDRTNWYAVDTDALERAEAEFWHNLNLAHPSGQNDITHPVKGHIELMSPAKLRKQSGQSERTVPVKMADSSLDKKMKRNEEKREKGNFSNSLTADEAAMIAFEELPVADKVFIQKQAEYQNHTVAEVMRQLRDNEVAQVMKRGK